MNHSPEPWSVDIWPPNPNRPEPTPSGYIVAANGNSVAWLDIADAVGREWMPNAERIVACVNACAGIPTEALNALITGGAITLTGLRRQGELRSITITNEPLPPGQIGQVAQVGPKLEAGVADPGDGGQSEIQPANDRT